MHDLVIRNADVVLGDEVRRSDVLVRSGVIEALDQPLPGAGEDFAGDYLIPGLVELHTDHLETHFAPRPKVRWNAIAAVQAHDAQMAASGITTVFDALRVGIDEDTTITSLEMVQLAGAINAAADEGRLRAEHFIHLRCEVSEPDVREAFELFERQDRVRLASLMDHTPGQRQFTSMEAYRVYYQGKSGMSDVEFAAFVARRQERAGTIADANRAWLAQRCNAAGIALASHDDAIEAHVAEAAAQGISVAEFPTTMAAARASRAAGMKILMGAPNLVRGGSHSGNISARDLAEADYLDILSSDYVPFSLIHAAFLAAHIPGWTLPRAIALVTRNPAVAVGLEDRGVIRIGARADLVRVTVRDDIPIVRGVWREGRRVA